MSRARVAESGSRATLVLLSLIVVVAVVLAWEAYAEAHEHRLAAERMVRDYARGAGQELITRSQRDASLFVLLPIQRRMLEWQSENSRAKLPTREQLMSTSDSAWMKGILPIYRGAFIVDMRDGSCSVSDPAIHDAVCRDLLAELRANVGEGEGQIALEQDHVYLGYAPMTKPVIRGYWADDAIVRQRIRFSFERMPLIPAHLNVPNKLLFVEVRDRNGKTFFKTPGQYEPERGWESRIAFETAPYYKDVTVRASINAAAIPQLVSGGMPHSPLPLLLTMLGLTLALIAAAVRQVVKERALAQLRSDFVSSVSHELRTPLTQIRMFAETLLLARVRSPEEERRSLTIIDQEARRLSHLVENVLRLSQSERGRLKIVRAPAVIAPVVAETVETFTPIARARQVDFALDLQSDAVAAVDGESLRQIVLNLLDNAVKYGPAGQLIEVAIHETPTSVQISVDDEGPGIPLRERERIWRKFERLGRDQSSHKAGSGIGLAVVRELVLLHGGSAWVEEGSRGGARFILELPKRAAATTRIAAAEEEPQPAR